MDPSALSFLQDCTCITLYYSSFLVCGQYFTVTRVFIFLVVDQSSLNLLADSSPELL